jgi:hypothetical protein
MKETAKAYLGKGISKAVITLPAYFVVLNSLEDLLIFNFFFINIDIRLTSVYFDYFFNIFILYEE